MPYTLHKPVMLKEVIEFFNLKETDIVLDCTIGVGGHASQILKKIKKGLLIGIDKDAESLKIAEENLKKIGSNFILFHQDFRNLDLVLKKAKVKKVDKVLFDLGISSFQLDNPERGFSFSKEGPLDMRMDRTSFVCAADLINNLTFLELFKIIKEFGEEKFAKKIAYQIVQERRKTPFKTTSQLREVIERAVPFNKRQRIHPATRTFQALRIAVNRELESLESALDKIFYFLNPKGVCIVISFHSLEDRIVKKKFKEFYTKGMIEILTKKPLVPSKQEIEQNFRARSAKLRAAQKNED